MMRTDVYGEIVTNSFNIPHICCSKMQSRQLVGLIASEIVYWEFNQEVSPMVCDGALPSLQHRGKMP
jgi:hypothetical protein